MTERELVEGSSEKNAKSQRRLFEQYAGKMMTVCLRYACDKAEAEDILQESFIKIFAHISQYKFKGSLEGWIRRIVVNTALRVLQKKKIEFTAIDEDLDIAQTMNVDALTALSAEELLKLISCLPDGYRIVFNLCHASNGYTPAGNHKPHGRHRPSQPGYLASATSAKGSTTKSAAGSTTGSKTESTTVLAPEPTAARPAVNSPRPTSLAARLTIIHPSVRLPVTAQTLNARSSRNLVVPAVPYQPTTRWRIDGFAFPEYFSFKEFGFSYGAGARATYVFKQHFTVTAGLQYLKVDVQARQKNDSFNSLFPGIFNNIQLPVLFGYTTGNQRFSISVNAGAIFSLYAEAKGRLKDYGWPNHNGITSYLGLNFATHVSDRLSMFAEPYIKCWYPQKFQALPPQLFSTGISVGLRYDLK